MEDAENLRKQIIEAEEKLRALQSRLAFIETTCRHTWSSPVRTSEKYTEFVPQMTNPTYHGIHIEYPITAVEKSRALWVRKCTCCGKTEKTTKTTEKVEHVPHFGG